MGGTLGEQGSVQTVCEASDLIHWMNDGLTETKKTRRGQSSRLNESKSRQENRHCSTTDKKAAGGHVTLGIRGRQTHQKGWGCKGQGSCYQLEDTRECRSHRKWPPTSSISWSPQRSDSKYSECHLRGNLSSAPAAGTRVFIAGTALASAPFPHSGSELCIGFSSRETRFWYRR